MSRRKPRVWGIVSVSYLALAVRLPKAQRHQHSAWILPTVATVSTVKRLCKSRCRRAPYCTAEKLRRSRTEADAWYVWDSS